MKDAHAELSDEQKEQILSFYRETVEVQEQWDNDEPVIRKAQEIEEPDRTRLAAIRSTDLLEKKYQRLCQPVEGLITEGLTLLVGASKIGKSWLVLSMCLAAANGTDFLGHATEQCGVLYMALEDSERRLQSRIRKLNGGKASENLYFCTNALTLENGIEKQLTNWFSENPDTRLIVIDTLQMVRGGQQAVKDVYQNDYATMQKLKTIADARHAGIVLVHHTNKQKNVEDNFDKVSGSTGLMGAADTTILIDRARDSKQATVRVVGRDVYCDDFLIGFEKGEWRLISNHAAEFDSEQAYINSPITQTIRCLVAQKPEGGKWSYEDVRTAGINLLGYAPFSDSKDFVNKLRGIEDQLISIDKIIVTASVKVGQKRGIHIEMRKPFTSFQTQSEL
jgi:predicted ATP-dependent serine protease